MTTRDAELQSEQILEHLDWVRRLARRLVADASAADDVAQEVWLVAMMRPWSEGGPPRAWLARVVGSVARKLGRRATVRRDHEDAAAGELTSEGSVLRRAAVQRELVDAVFELREPYRGAILMRYFDGLSPTAIARRRGVPTATVKTHLRRGLALLRERLDDAHGARGVWLLALAPLARRGSSFGTTSAGVWIVSMKLVAGTVVALGLAAVAGVWWTGRVHSPTDGTGSVVARAPVELVSAEPPTLVDAGRVEQARAVTATDAAEEAPHEKEAELDPAGTPSALELRLDDTLESFRTDAPRVDALRTLLTELGGTSSVALDSLAVDEHGVLRGELVLPFDGVRGDFRREENGWHVDLAFGASPRGPASDFPLRVVSLSFSDDVASGAATVQHHPDPRRAATALGVDEAARTVGWTVSTSAESGTNLDSIRMSRAPSGGIMIGRLPERPVEERPWDFDRRCFEPWADLLRPCAR